MAETDHAAETHDEVQTDCRDCEDDDAGEQGQHEGAVGELGIDR